MAARLATVAPRIAVFVRWRHVAIMCAVWGKIVIHARQIVAFAVEKRAAMVLVPVAKHVIAAPRIAVFAPRRKNQ
jgi:hypothetical protein